MDNSLNKDISPNPIWSDKKQLGAFGEQLAINYLIQQGHKILETNYRFSKFGEIDIISQEKEYICFVEVKTRTSTFFGLPSEAVNYPKQAKIKRLASCYLKQNNLYEHNVRFDIVEVMLNKNSNNTSVKFINLIRNAF